MLAVVLGVSRVDLLAVILAIALVLIAEMINTALEAAVDLAQPDPHPLAKVAKDVAAGGVLISAACSLAVGYLVFADRLSASERARDPPGALVLARPDADRAPARRVSVIAAKAISHRGTPLSGGLPSGHAAVAFAGLHRGRALDGRQPAPRAVASLALLMALLVAQTRVESGVHSGVGGRARRRCSASRVTLLVFQLVR